MGARKGPRLAGRGNPASPQLSDRALRLFGFLQADPANVELACALIDELLNTQRSSDALEAISNLHSSLARLPAVRSRMARAQLSEGKLESAVATLQSLLDEGTDVPAVRHDLAFAQLCLGDIRGAAHTIAPAVALHDVPVECRVLQARVLQAQGELTKAIETLGHPDASQHAGALGLKSLFLLDAGDTEGARHCAAACLAMQADQLEALIVAGTVSLWSGDLDTAMQAFQRALSQAPTTGRALSGLGQVRMLRGDLAAARASFEAAIAAMPDHLGTWHALAWACLLGGDVAAADAAFRSAYTLDRTFGETHGGLALIHVLRRQPAEAEAAIKRALKLDPRGRTAHYARSLLLLQRGQSEAAENEVRDILDHVALPARLSVSGFLQQLHELMQPSS